MSRAANFNPVSRHNELIDLNQDQASEIYWHVLKWLEESRIRYATIKHPTIYRTLIDDFWRTAKYVDEDASHIVATVQGKKVIITEELINKALKLKDDLTIKNKFDNEETKAAFYEVGYEGDFSKTEVQKSYLIAHWKLIFEVFRACFSHRLSGFEGISFEWGGCMMKLCKGEPVNISGQIFKRMKHNAEVINGKRLLYPRFLQILFNFQYKELAANLDSQVEEVIKVSMMTSRSFDDCLRRKEGCIGLYKPLFKNMYHDEDWKLAYQTYLEIKKRQDIAIGKKKKEGRTKKRKTGGESSRGEEINEEEVDELTVEHAKELAKFFFKGLEKNPPIKRQSKVDEEIEVPSSVRTRTRRGRASVSIPAESSSKRGEDIPKKEIERIFTAEAGSHTAKAIMYLKERVEKLEKTLKFRTKDLKEQRYEIKKLYKRLNDKNKAFRCLYGAMFHMYQMMKETHEKNEIETKLNFLDMFEDSETIQALCDLENEREKKLKRKGEMKASEVEDEAEEEEEKTEDDNGDDDNNNDEDNDKNDNVVGGLTNNKNGEDRGTKGGDKESEPSKKDENISPTASNESPKDCERMIKNKFDTNSQSVQDREVETSSSPTVANLEENTDPELLQLFEDIDDEANTVEPVVIITDYDGKVTDNDFTEKELEGVEVNVLEYIYPLCPNSQN